jgi:hypothetical protein
VYGVFISAGRFAQPFPNVERRLMVHLARRALEANRHDRMLTIKQQQHAMTTLAYYKADQVKANRLHQDGKLRSSINELRDSFLPVMNIIREHRLFTKLSNYLTCAFYCAEVEPLPQEVLDIFKQDLVDRQRDQANRSSYHDGAIGLARTYILAGRFAEASKLIDELDPHPQEAMNVPQASANMALIQLFNHHSKQALKSLARQNGLQPRPLGATDPQDLIYRAYFDLGDIKAAEHARAINFSARNQDDRQWQLLRLAGQKNWSPVKRLMAEIMRDSENEWQLYSKMLLVWDFETVAKLARKGGEESLAQDADSFAKQLLDKSASPSRSKFREPVKPKN